MKQPQQEPEREPTREELENEFRLDDAGKRKALKGIFQQFSLFLTVLRVRNKYVLGH